MKTEKKTSERKKLGPGKEKVDISITVWERKKKEYKMKNENRHGNVREGEKWKGKQKELWK